MHVLAIDAGTTGVTGLVLDAERQVVGRAYGEIRQRYPQPGWVEHDPMEIRNRSIELAHAACKEAGIRPRDVQGVGITNQRETTVVWDAASGEPIHPAIVWQDRRTVDVCHKLRRQQKAVRAKTGLQVDAYFSATKIAWILDHVKGARKRAEVGELRFGTVDTWLAWSLTGEHVTDPTNASRTLLWDIHRSCWDDDLLELFGVPRAMLPDVVPSSHVIGPCQDLGGAPLAALVGDQQAALFGQGATEAGQAKNTYGTGCFLLQHTGTVPVTSKHGLLTTRAASLDDTPQYALEGSVFVGGAAIQWLRDGLGVLEASSDVNDLAGTVDDADGVVVVPAFAGLGAPHWDGDIRGAVLGITPGTSKAHLARATLDAIAWQVDDVLRAMAKDSGEAVKELRVDGGASQSDLLLQLQADASGCKVVRAKDVETTARGAAALAGIAVGAWDAPSMHAAKRFQPQAKRGAVKASRKRWHAAIKAASRFKP